MGNIQNVKDFYDKEVKKAISTLMKCSYDDSNDKYLVKSEVECFNYDKIKEHFFKTSIQSVDSLYFDISRNSLYFIEFRNCGPSKDLISILKSKGVYSLLLYFSCMRYVDNYDYDTNNGINLIYLAVLNKKKHSTAKFLEIAARNSGLQKNYYQSVIDELKSDRFQIFKKYDDVIVCYEDDFGNYIPNVN